MAANKGSVASEADALFSRLLVRVDSGLPEGLRRPLLEYLGHLVHERGLAEGTVQSLVHTNRGLCRLLAEQGEESFARLHVNQLDQLVSSLLTAPPDDVLRRRRQVQRRHSELRGFLSFLHRQGLVDRDLSRSLISPPCYRSSTPPRVLTGEQVKALLDSVDRESPKGRRCSAILLLSTTYGLRPVDIARLRLDAIHWREERFTLVQSKTGHVLTLPLLTAVAEALVLYLQQDRPSEVPFREVFLSLYRPHQPLPRRTVSILIKEALAEAGFCWAGSRQLRATVASHLLRAGEAFGTIQDVLGHRSAETTQRYAVTDLELLRRVLEESER
jgi:integrase/recombinase XerD